MYSILAVNESYWSTYTSGDLNYIVVNGQKTKDKRQ